MKSCKECKEPIHKARLEAIPDTKYCVKCAEKFGPQKPIGFMVYSEKAGGEFITVDPKDQEAVRRAKRAHQRKY